MRRGFEGEGTAGAKALCIGSNRWPEALKGDDNRGVSKADSSKEIRFESPGGGQVMWGRVVHGKVFRVYPKRICETSEGSQAGEWQKLTSAGRYLGNGS